MDWKNIFKEVEEEKKPEVVETPEAKEKPEVVEEPKEEPKVEASFDADKLADQLATKIAKAVSEAKGFNERDTSSLKEQIAHKDLKSVDYPAAGELGSLSREQKMVTWFKALINKDRSLEADRVFKALIEGTDSQGGYLVPEEWRAEVFRILPDYSVMRKLATIIPMKHDTFNLTTLIAEPAAYWTAEYASKSTTSAEFDQVVLSPNDLVCLIPVTHQLIDDAHIDIIRFITQLFAEKIGRTEDKAFFAGTGTGQPTGIRSCAGVATTAVGGAGTYKDLLTALYGLPQTVRSAPKTAWVTNRKTISNLHKMEDSNGRPLLLPSGMSNLTERPREMLFGYGLYEQNDLPNNEIWFGDWSKYAIGDRQSIVVETTREGGDAWRRNATEIKAVERVDGKCILSKAFYKLTGF